MTLRTYRRHRQTINITWFSLFVLFDRIAKQVRSMNWRKPSVCLSVRIAFSLVSHKPLMIQESNLVSLYTLMSSSRLAQNFVTLTLTSRFSEHTLILTLACLWMVLKGVVLPSSYLMLSWLLDHDDFYWIVTFTCDLDLEFSCSRSHGILC